MTDPTTPSETPTVPSTPLAKQKATIATARKNPVSGAARRPKKKPASSASSRPASGPKKKPAKSRKVSPKSKKRGKVPGHWSKTHAQLVLHATPELVAKLDKKIAKLGKALKLAKPTRGSIVRALVERAVK